MNVLILLCRAREDDTKLKRRHGFIVPSSFSGQRQLDAADAMRLARIL